MYVSFYHGRNTVDQILDNWGEDGPIVGPLEVQWTYGTVKFYYDDEMHHVVTVPDGDMIPIDGKYYADFNVYTDEDPRVLEEMDKDKIMSLEKFVELNKAQ